MSQLEGSTEASARGEGECTRVTRVALPPPPVAGLRAVARLRGAFDEGLPTLRLPTLPPRAWAHADAATLDEVVRTARGDTKIGRPFSPSSILRTGPRVLAPATSRAIRELVEDEEPESIDDADLLDDDEAGATLVRPIVASISLCPGPIRETPIRAASPVTPARR